MLTGITVDDWVIVLEVFDAAQSRSGQPGYDRKFLEALHYFKVHNMTCRALPAEYGNTKPRPLARWESGYRIARSLTFLISYLRSLDSASVAK